MTHSLPARHGSVEAADVATWTGKNLGMGTALPPPSYYTSIYKGSNGRVFVRAREQGRDPGQERSHRARNPYELWGFQCIHGDGCTIFPL